MNARTSWSARKAGEAGSADPQSVADNRPLDDILDARFDEEGRLAQVGRGGSGTAEHLDPRPPAMAADELERAVQKLARGLDAIERQSRARKGAPLAAGTGGAAPSQVRQPRDDDFVTYSLDRLESRLEALSRRLQSRSGAAGAAPSQAREDMVVGTPPATDAPSLAAPAASELEERRAEVRRLAEAADAARRRLEAEEEAAAAAARVAAERPAEPMPTVAAEVAEQFAALEARIEALLRDRDENEIEPLRKELLGLLRQIEELGRDGRSVADAVERATARLDEMEAKVNAARNMAGNRLGEIQDRLAGLTERLGDVEAEVPGFDALRENQSAILERFDRMEGLVHRSSPPEGLLERLEDLKRQMRTVASQREATRIEEQVLHLAERIEQLPETVSDRAALARMEEQLQTIASELIQARRHSDDGAGELHARLADLYAGLKEVGEAAGKPDLSALDVRLADVISRVDSERRFSGEALARLDKRIAALAEAVERQENDAATELLAGLTERMDSLATAIGAQSGDLQLQNLKALDHKLDQLARTISEQSPNLPDAQLEPLVERLDRMQEQLEDLAARSQDSSAQIGPFAQTLQEISERLGGLAPAADSDAFAPLAERLDAIEQRLAGLSPKGGDSRALHNQLEGIVSRLELLKGRSIDPARLTELFERVDAAMRNGFPDERLERIEEKLDAGATWGAAEERFSRLEQKLDEIVRSGGGAAADITDGDIADLRGDITALRRELRSLPGLGQEEGNLGDLLKAVSSHLERLPGEAPATAADLDRQMQRIADLLEDPAQNRLALAHIETSLKSLEERLDDTAGHFRRAGDDADDAAAVGSLARSLSDDVTVLRGATEMSERRTRDALEAVQGTLEAVVKRMAFLERDADRQAETERHEAAAPEAVQASEPEAEADTAAVAPAVVPAVAPAMPDLQAEPAPDAVREQPTGLFSRFTSSQLLRRATGGRAESFSPDLDDGEEAPDLPLEPGTDSPLDSALADAPSSDTARLAGGQRSRSETRQAGLDTGPGTAPRPAFAPLPGDDFLAAARRAAQAAAAEVAEAERSAEDNRQSEGGSRLRRLLRPRRRVVLACALVVAVAFAAVQIVRTPEAPAPAPAPVATAPEADDRVDVADAPVATPATPPQATAEVPPVEPAPDPVARSEEGEETAAAPEASGAVSTPPAETAMLQPDPALESAASLEPEPEPEPAPAAPPALSDTQSPADLPQPVGPDRLQEAALEGDPHAAFEVAARYAEGRGTAQSVEAAVAWYEQAARGGLAPAQYRLGSIYEKGNGVDTDLAAAQEWYRQAADAGNVKAMHNLAVLYAEGAGGEPDLERAAELFRQAAQHGVRDSQFNLAILHARGLGVQQDMTEAYKWFAIAAGSGDAEALKRRDILAEALSEADLAKAQAAAASFEPLQLVPEANEVTAPEGGWGQEAATSGLPTENDMVALVQKLLAEKGLDPGPADGLLGRQTIQAISAFQQQSGLPPTGQIDPALVARLQERPS